MAAGQIGFFRIPMPPVTRRHGLAEPSDMEPGSLWLHMAGHWLAQSRDADAASPMTALPVTGMRWQRHSPRQ